MLATRLGDRVGVATSRLTQSSALLELGRWDEYAAICSEYLDHDAPELAVPVVSRLVGSGIWLQLWRGDLDAARIVLAIASEHTDDANVEQQGMLDAAHAGVASAEGRPLEALTSAEAGLRSCLDQSFPVVACANLIEAVDAAFTLGRDEKVEELIDLVRRHYRPGRQRAIDAHIHRWRAALAARREAGGVAEEFAAAMDAFSTLSRPFWLAVTQLEFAEWLMRQERDAEAAALLIQSRSAFARLGRGAMDRTRRRDRAHHDRHRRVEVDRMNRADFLPA